MTTILKELKGLYTNFKTAMEGLSDEELKSEKPQTLPGQENFITKINKIIKILAKDDNKEDITAIVILDLFGTTSRRGKLCTRKSGLFDIEIDMSTQKTARKAARMQ